MSILRSSGGEAPPVMEEANLHLPPVEVNSDNGWKIPRVEPGQPRVDPRDAMRPSDLPHPTMHKRHQVLIPIPHCSCWQGLQTQCMKKKSDFPQLSRMKKCVKQMYEKVREKVHEKVHENWMQKIPGFFNRI